MAASDYLWDVDEYAITDGRGRLTTLLVRPLCNYRNRYFSIFTVAVTVQCVRNVYVVGVALNERLLNWVRVRERAAGPEVGWTGQHVTLFVDRDLTGQDNVFDTVGGHLFGVLLFGNDQQYLGCIWRINYDGVRQCTATIFVSVPSFR